MINFLSYEMLELKIGDLEEHEQIKEMGLGCWRFVVSKDDSIILLYAGAIPLDKSYGHRDVVSRYNLEVCKILGGGDIRHSFGRLIFEDMSADFGIVPNSVMDGFARKVFENCKDNKYPPIKEIEINMWYDSEVSEKNIRHVQRWRELGFEFDNDKRVISV